MNGNKFDCSDGRDDTEGFPWAKNTPKLSVSWRCLSNRAETPCFLFLELLLKHIKLILTLQQRRVFLKRRHQTTKLLVLHLSATVTPRS